MGNEYDEILQNTYDFHPMYEAASFDLKLDRNTYIWPSVKISLCHNGQ
jgi:hypothetical protein